MVALFIALMFIGFVLVDVVVQRLAARRALAAVAAPQVWDVPRGFFLSEGHTWSCRDSSAGVRVGADALLPHALGAVKKVVPPKPGELVKAGQPLFRLENQGCELEVPSSIAGRVVALNPDLGKRPELVAEDPYGSGWICAIAPTRSNGGHAKLRSGNQAQAWLEQEFHRFREFLSLQISPDRALNVTYPDGGLPALGSLAQLRRSAWRAFEEEFLRPRTGPPTP
jgi:glycine cleavage system H protein